MSSMLGKNNGAFLILFPDTIMSDFFVSRLQRLPRRVTNPHKGKGSTSKRNWRVAATGIAYAGKGNSHEGYIFQTEILQDLQELYIFLIVFKCLRYMII